MYPGLVQVPVDPGLQPIGEIGAMSLELQSRVVTGLQVPRISIMQGHVAPCWNKENVLSRKVTQT